MIDEAALYLAKAEESLTGAELELEDGRYNNCANRCYYACFQAAICALMRAGIRPSGGRGEWGHNFMPAQFEGVLINTTQAVFDRLAGRAHAKLRTSSASGL